MRRETWLVVISLAWTAAVAATLLVMIVMC
jgi:hypothetical protein